MFPDGFTPQLDFPPEPPGPVGTFVLWIGSYLLLLGMILWLLPVSWSRWILRIALPFMPERLEDLWRKKQ